MYAYDADDPRLSDTGVIPDDDGAEIGEEGDDGGCPGRIAVDAIPPSHGGLDAVRRDEGLVHPDATGARRETAPDGVEAQEPAAEVDGDGVLRADDLPGVSCFSRQPRNQVSRRYLIRCGSFASAPLRRFKSAS